MSSIVIYGAGGFGREVRSMLSAPYSFSGFVDDREGGDFIGNGEWLRNQSSLSVILAFGNPFIRKKCWVFLQDANHMFPVIKHSSLIIQDEETVVIDRGCIVAAKSILTTNIHIKEFSIINLNCTIGHDVHIGAFSSIMASVDIGGGTIIEDNVYVGSNATILPYKRIGKGAVVGAGAVVTKDVPPGVTVKGVPAK